MNYKEYVVVRTYRSKIQRASNLYDPFKITDAAFGICYLFLY